MRWYYWVILVLLVGSGLFWLYWIYSDNDKKENQLAAARSAKADKQTLKDEVIPKPENSGSPIVANE